MSAFAFNVRYDLRDNIHQLFIRSAGHDRLTITPPEFQSLFVNAEDWDILHKAKKIATADEYGASTSFEMVWPTTILVKKSECVKIDVDGTYADLKFLFPKHPKIQPDVPVELLEKINAWVDRAIVRGADFGRTVYVLEQLDYHCINASAVRFMWPALQAIARVDKYKDNCHALADKIGKCRAPTRMPALSSGLKLACRKTGGTVAAALLLTDPPDAAGNAIQIGLSSRIRVIEEGLDNIEVLVE